MMIVVKKVYKYGITKSRRSAGGSLIRSLFGFKIQYPEISRNAIKFIVCKPDLYNEKRQMVIIRPNRHSIKKLKKGLPSAFEMIRGFNNFPNRLKIIIVQVLSRIS